MSISAYRRTIVATESPKEIERRILTRINSVLTAHKDQFDALTSRSERHAMLSGSLKVALAENLKFWSAIRADLILPENGYPEELRASLISLAFFVDNQTTRILSGTGEISPLADVNASIILGMSGIAEPA